MFGIAFALVALFVPALAINALDRMGEPVYPPEPAPAQFYGPSRRVFEIAKALS